MKRKTLFNPILILALILASVSSLFVTPAVRAASNQAYPAGMVSYWKFDEGSGAAAADIIGGHDGVIQEATWTTGQVGGALHFDGTNDRVEIADDFAFRPDGEFTTEAWIYPESNISEQVIFSALWPALYQLFITGNQVVLNYYYDTVSGYYIIGSDLPALNMWHHIVATYKESGASATSRVYVDGVEKVEFTGTSIARTSRDGPVYIGANHDWAGGQREFIGSIDEVAVYNKALTAAEIQQHYQNGLNGLGYEEISSTTSLVATTTATEIYPGDPLSVDLTLQNAEDLYAAQADCTADAAVLQPQDADFGDFFDPINRLVAVNNADAAAGTWSGAISQRSPATPLSGDGLFATIHYLAQAPGTTSIACDPLLADQDGFIQPVTFTGADVTVLPFATASGAATYQGRATDQSGITLSASGPVNLSATTAANGDFLLDALKAGDYAVKADASLYLPACTSLAGVEPGDETDLGSTTLRGGDVNDDEAIDIGDASRIGAGFGDPDPAADINADGIVNVQDLAILGGNYGLSGCQGW